MLLDLMARAGLGDELVVPASEAEAIEAARDAVDRGYDVVVAAGGDGTMGLVGRQLLGSRTALGILPLGSVMNIPRMLGLPRDPEAAARILAAGHVRSIDVGLVGDRVFYEAGSVGMHAAATRELPLVDGGDYGAIVRSIIAAIRYRPSEVRIELDGDRTIATNAVAVAVANGPFIGPGLAVAPEALLDDGLFDVRVFLHYTRAELLRSVWSIVRGRRPQERRSLTERARWVRITSGRPLPVRADAVDMGTTPVRFQIQPSVLTVVAPDAPASTAGSGRHGPHVRDAAMALRPTDRPRDPGLVASSPRRSEEPELPRQVDRLLPRVRAELLVDVAHVRLDGARGDEDLSRDLGSGEVAREVAEHPYLALGERFLQRRQVACRPPHRRPGKDVQDVCEQGGMRGAVPRVPFQELARRRDEERQDERVRLGEVERPLHVILRRLRVTQRVAREGVEEERVDERGVADDRGRAFEHGREDLHGASSVLLGEVNRRQRRARVGVPLLRVGRCRQRGPSRLHATQPHERLRLVPAGLGRQRIG